MPCTRDILREGLEELVENDFKSEWNTDLTISCQGEKFFAHKIILGAQSDFFRKAFNPESPFMEARTGVISLDDDDPFFVKLMLVYCYTGELDDWLISEWNETYYNHGHYRYTSAGVPIAAVLIYALADKYQVKGLKFSAERNLKSWLSDSLCRESDWPVVIPRIARKIYRTTPSTDRGLRDLILYYVQDEINNFGTVMRCRRFKKNMDKVEGFWAEYVDYTAQVSKRPRECPNQDCMRLSEPEFPRWTIRRQGVTAQCPSCRKRFSISEWSQLDDADEAIETDDDSDDEATQHLESSNKRKASEEDEESSPPVKSVRLADAPAP